LPSGLSYQSDHMREPWDPDLAELDRLLRTIFGIGPVVAATLIAELPELDLLSGKQVAALVGPPGRPGAAHPQSGKTRWRESIGHGRPGMHRVLFNAARSASPTPRRSRTSTTGW
jgi:transposase